jgi:hypothetical protein
MTPDERIAELEGVLAEQHQQLELALAQNAALQARIEELEARLAKDSHNSSKPPSSVSPAAMTTASHSASMWPDPAWTSLSPPRS